MRWGTANKDLPTFVNVGRPSSPVQLSGGYLGSSYSATPFQPGDVPIPNLLPPKSSDRKQRDREMQALLNWTNSSAPITQIESEIAGARGAFELAAA
jgi:hypothetical protein